MYLYNMNLSVKTNSLLFTSITFKCHTRSEMKEIFCIRRLLRLQIFLYVTTYLVKFDSLFIFLILTVKSCLLQLLVLKDNLSITSENSQ